MIERIFAFNATFDTVWATRQIATIHRAISVLEGSPHIGRPIPRSALRELVISLRTTGSIALYAFDEAENRVRIVAIRNQREAGHRGR